MSPPLQLLSLKVLYLLHKNAASAPMPTPPATNAGKDRSVDSSTVKLVRTYTKKRQDFNIQGRITYQVSQMVETVSA